MRSCFAAGAVLVVVGLVRARAPWSRYRELKAQDENIKRYEAWRGGIRSDEKTGASVAMAILRRQAQIGAAIAIVGGVLIVAGFVVRLSAGAERPGKRRATAGQASGDGRARVGRRPGTRRATAGHASGDDPGSSAEAAAGPV